MEKKLYHTFIVSAVILLSAAATVTWSREVADGIRVAVDACIYTMIPSLYAMLILSGLFMKSGICAKASRVIEKPVRAIFGCSGEVFTIFIVSQFAGYPVGCTMLSTLVESGRITKHRASILSGCCYGCGPAFLGAVFSSSKDVHSIFIACTISNLLLFLCCSRVNGKSDLPCKQNDSFSLSLVEATISSGKAMLRICAMVLLFGAVFGIIEGTGLQNLIDAEFGNIIFPFLEISRIADCLPYSHETLPWLGAMISFGGVCVLMQLGAASQGKISLGFVLFMRTLAALITFIVIAFLNPFTPSEDAIAAVAVDCSPVFEMGSSTPLPSIILKIMTFMLLGIPKKE